MDGMFGDWRVSMVDRNKMPTCAACVWYEPKNEAGGWCYFNPPHPDPDMGHPEVKLFTYCSKQWKGSW